MAWTFRYRLKISHPIASDEKALSFSIGGHEVVVSGEGDKPLRDSAWLTLNAHGMNDEATARAFGQRTALSLLLAGVQNRIGFDPGQDRATSSFSTFYADSVMQHSGRKLMPNVHGLLVYERLGNELFTSINAKLTALIEPSVLFCDVAYAFNNLKSLGDREQTALVLTNLSNIAQDPLSQAVLSISAVECLSLGVSWTQAQRDLIDRLRTQAAKAIDLPPDEIKEVVDAFDYMFKSIRQAIKRKIISLGLSRNDWKNLDKVYSLRSGIFHGTETSRDRHAELATMAREICAKIVRAAIEAS